MILFAVIVVVMIVRVRIGMDLSRRRKPFRYMDDREMIEDLHSLDAANGVSAMGRVAVGMAVMAGGRMRRLCNCM